MLEKIQVLSQNDSFANSYYTNQCLTLYFVIDYVSSF